MTDADRHSQALVALQEAANLLDNTQGQLRIVHIEQAAARTMKALCLLNYFLNAINGSQAEYVSIEDPQALISRPVDKPI